MSSGSVDFLLYHPLECEDCVTWFSSSILSDVPQSYRSPNRTLNTNCKTCCYSTKFSNFRQRFSVKVWNTFCKIFKIILLFYKNLCTLRNLSCLFLSVGKRLLFSGCCLVLAGLGSFMFPLYQVTKEMYSVQLDIKLNNNNNNKKNNSKDERKK